MVASKQGKGASTRKPSVSHNTSRGVSTAQESAQTGWSHCEVESQGEKYHNGAPHADHYQQLDQDHALIVLGNKNDDDALKKKLAIMVASAGLSIPGAFDINGRPLPKPSQKLLAKGARIREDEKKLQQNREKDGPIIGPVNEGQPLEDFQERMNEFMDETNKEDQEAQKIKKEERERRKRRRCSIVAMGFIVVITGAVVGVVLAIKSGSTKCSQTPSQLPPLTTLPSALSKECIGSDMGQETEQNSEYQRCHRV